MRVLTVVGNRPQFEGGGPCFSRKPPPLTTVVLTALGTARGGGLSNAPS